MARKSVCLKYHTKHVADVAEDYFFFSANRQYIIHTLTQFFSFLTDIYIYK